jgi:hypothetical protein
VNEHDVRVVLSRLPQELYARLRAVHFNDRSRGGRTLGYVNYGFREIALCAIAPRVSLTRFLVKGETPADFGARRNSPWPPLAVRRYMLYDVFLHELGHLQLVDLKRPSVRLRFAHEKLAREFASEWRATLWSLPFDHPEPVHNPPSLRVRA